MSSLPAETVPPTPDEIEFAKLWLDCERHRRTAGDRMWPKLTSDSAYKKAGKWLEKPGVQFALQAFGESTKHDVRLWLERVGFGEKDRVERAAIIGKHSQDPLKYIEYCDKRSGIVEERQENGIGNNILEAIVLGAIRVRPDNSGAGFSGVRGEVPLDSDQEFRPSAVHAVADAGGQG